MKKIFTLLTGLIISNMIFSQTLDQSNTSSTGSGWLVNSGAYISAGQSFTAGLTGDLAQVNINISVDNPVYPIMAGTFILNIYDGSGFGGTLLGTQSFSITGTESNGEYLIPISSTISLTSGNAYTYEIDELSGTGQLMLNASNDVYASGVLYNNTGSPSAFTGYDFIFKTYMNLPMCPISDQTTAATLSDLCPTNTGTTITTNSSEIGVNYYLRNSTNDSLIDGPLAGTGSGLTFNTGALTSTTTYKVYAEVVDYAPSAVALDGVDEYITVADAPELVPTTGNFTAEIWGKSNTANWNNYGLLMCKRDSYIIHTEAGSNGVTFYLYTDDVTGGFLYNGITDITEWHHYAMSWDGNTLFCYVDGILVGSVPCTGNMAASTNNLEIGKDNLAGRYLNGSIDDARIWNVERSQTEIYNNFKNTLAGTETGLVLYIPMNEGTGFVAADITGNGHDGALINTEDPTDWILGAPNAICSSIMSTTPTVTVQDILAPVEDVTNLTTLTDECSVAAPTAPTATDACMGTITGTTSTTFPMTESGTITWTFDDGNGNTSTQDQMVTINDATAPVADLASLTDVTATCSVTSLTEPTATDNCAGTVTVTNDATFPITESGIITWTYDDGNGNTSTQNQNVIINAPVIDVTTTTANFVITANNSTATGYQWIDCNNSNAAINGETNTSYTALVNGDYAVIVIDGDCSDTSDCVNISGLGINEVQDLTVSIYPNPNNGEFTISTTENNVSINIYSADGKMIINNLKVTEANQLINLGNVESGIYFVTLTNKVSRNTIRLIIE